MKIIVLYPNAFWLLLTLPMLRIFHSKFIGKPSILTPNTALLKKIIGDQSASKFDFLLICRYLEILCLVLAYAEPMAMASDSIFRCNKYLAMASFACFLLEIFLRNTFLQKIP
ncbi:MAG: hypothetical protein LBI56_00130 [Puniceicoccales bacterium]|jgi:hypothetical protein|nr:hypothetical protein [Puniceicoccales bacterium]